MSSMFVVQSYFTGRRGVLIADTPLQAQNTNHARRIAERLALQKTLVIAFSRSGNPKTGEYDEARLIAAYGEVPDDVLAMPRA